MNSPTQELPFISILLAARNEAHQITECLQALAQIDYPVGQWEVWVGDDDSEDTTFEVVQGFIEGLPHFHLMRIEKTLGAAKGKANVLAHLARKAKGTVFLCTDADVIVPTTWAKALLSHWEPSMGVVTGFTLVEGSSVFAHLQGIDWVWALTLIKQASDLGIATTAMGNNMLISRESYEEVGGYESIPFSVTEDYALFRAITDKGWGFKQLLSPEVMASTTAIDTWQGLIQQRKRWMHGAMQVPWFLKIGLWVQVLWLPVMLVGLFYAPFAVLGIWAVKLLWQSMGIIRQLHYIGRKPLIPYILLYEPYVLLVYIAMVASYYWPSPVQWKGRSY